MELLQFKYFCVVAKYENMSQAAEELHIVQPAISQSIKRLEKEMGVTLFERKGKKLSLNKAGLHLYEILPNILRTLDELPGELKELAHLEEHKVSICVKASSHVIPTLISMYRKVHPNVKFSILNHESENWDICITSQYSGDTIEEGDIVLLEEEILMATDDPKYKNADAIDLMNLEKAEFIGLREGSVFRFMTDKLMERLGISIGYAHESDNPSLVREIIEALGGYAFFPEITWGKIHNPTIKCMHIVNEDFKRKIILKKNSKKNHQTLQDFILYCRDYYSTL